MRSGRNQSTTPDLFSTASVRETSLLSASQPKRAPSTDNAAESASTRRHILPSDLPSALKQLDDREFDRLVAAVLAEQKRRGRKSPVSDEPSRKRRLEAVAVPLTTSKMNAIRAAFKGGVKPLQIARQFGVSQSDVRKTLSSHEQKR